MVVRVGRFGSSRNPPPVVIISSIPRAEKEGSELPIKKTEKTKRQKKLKILKNFKNLKKNIFLMRVFGFITVFIRNKKGECNEFYVRFINNTPSMITYASTETIIPMIA